jgi:hypothetical protein
MVRLEDWQNGLGPGTWRYYDRWLFASSLDCAYVVRCPRSLPVDCYALFLNSRSAGTDVL